jgi:hypothetical protein
MIILRIARNTKFILSVHCSACSDSLSLTGVCQGDRNVERFVRMFPPCFFSDNVLIGILGHKRLSGMAIEYVSIVSL